MFEKLIESLGQKVALSSKDLETLKSFFIPKKVRKRQYILNPGDVCHILPLLKRAYCVLLLLMMMDTNTWFNLPARAGGFRMLGVLFGKGCVV